MCNRASIKQERAYRSAWRGKRWRRRGVHAAPGKRGVQAGVEEAGGLGHDGCMREIFQPAGHSAACSAAPLRRRLLGLLSGWRWQKPCGASLACTALYSFVSSLNWSSMIFFCSTANGMES